MTADIHTLEYARERLNRKLKRLASCDGISLDFSSDVRTLNLCDRLFDSSIGDRRINIDYNPESERELDYFVRDFDSEIGKKTLLTLSINNWDFNSTELWKILKGWLYDQVDAVDLLFT